MDETIPAYELDNISNWTIKGFSSALRKRVVRAAEIEGVTVGTWLERCCRHMLQSEGVPAVEYSGSPPVPPSVPVNELIELALKFNDDAVREQVNRLVIDMVRAERRRLKS